MATLDGTLYYLGRNLDHTIFDLVMLRSDSSKGALVFQEVALASAHLRNLPKEVSVHVLSDERAKEEFLRAALAQGATEIWFDVNVDLEPQTVQPLADALFTILSLKRQIACL